MFVDLTTTVSCYNPLIRWAKLQDNPYIAMGHVGPHWDTYEKSLIPLEYFQSVGVLFDVRKRAEVSVADIAVDRIPENAFVLFRTGQIEKYSYGEKLYFDNHPQLSWGLIRLLCDKKVRFIGVDCAGIRLHAEHEEADRYCEKHGLYVIENLCHLERIERENPMIDTVWLDDERMTGIKCRVIAGNDARSGEIF